MFKYLVIAAITTCYMVPVQAFDLDLLANNKEAGSRFVRGKADRDIKRWIRNLNLGSTVLDKSKEALSSALKNFKNRDAYCDVGFTRLLKAEAMENGLLNNQEDYPAFVAYLRQANIIDDIFYKNIILSEDLNIALDNNANKGRPSAPLLKLNNEEPKDIDIANLYSDFKTWPDEISSCSVGRYNRLSMTLTWKNKNQRDRLLKKLNYLALEKNIIPLENYNKLEVIRERNALDWDVNTRNYLDIISNAKDKLSPSGKPEVDPSESSINYVVRKEKLTQRGRLYKNFDSTQVMMLAEIINKTSRRMDSHLVAINFQYEDSVDSEIETYVLSPMEKYRLSIKMLRKDMAEVMRSELFRNTNIEYGDLVAAAYETGLIRSEELDLILKFEDFWNPKKPKWKVYVNFTFSILGTTAIYLPPPWNIVGAIALIVTQTQINKKQRKSDPDDNWNAVI